MNLEKTIALSVPLKNAEEIRKYLREKNLLRNDLEIQRDKKFVYFPITGKNKELNTYITAEKQFKKREIKPKSYKEILSINEEIKQKLKACGDKDSNYDPFTRWGFYELHTEKLLDPYHFSLEAIKKLIEFVERYLELLGYNSFIEAQKQKDDDFTRTLKFFEQFNLGF